MFWNGVSEFNSVILAVDIFSLHKCGKILEVNEVAVLFLVISTVRGALEADVTVLIHWISG